MFELWIREDGIWTLHDRDRDLGVYELTCDVLDALLMEWVILDDEGNVIRESKTFEIA